MDSPAAIFTYRWLIRDTFRQALASRLFWLMLGASGVAILFCLSLSIDGGGPLLRPGDIELRGGDGQPLTGSNPRPGYLKVAFGAFRYPLFRDGKAEVHFLLVLLAKVVAGSFGLLLALIWTASFLPDFLRPEAASVLLAKPIPRWTLLVGKFVGVLAFVTLQAAVFFGGTWLALGLRTGFWFHGHLAGIPLFALSFACVYGFSALLAVWTRSTVISIFGAILFWGVCFGVNYARHAAAARPYLEGEAAAASPAGEALVDVGYWLLPKPADMALLLDSGLRAGDHFGSPRAFQTVEKIGAFHPGLSLLTSLAFTVAVLAFAAQRLGRREY
jgi:ABC-type transport system involved in multi-copper enzyme maturation permease subunit